MRTRWLLGFCGVFAVGLVLSGGLAARFTRPARKLDAGIRQLSGGDLDVTVDVEGKDEIARLGSAFNELASRLRAGRAMEREMTRREKLSALGSLAAGVAHDVRNPLHSVGLTLQHLQETGRPDEKVKQGEFDRSLSIIREEIGRLDRLVENFLRFTRTGEGDMGRLEAGGLLNETARLIHKEAEWRNITVEVEVPELSQPVEADIEAVRSSVLNLALNSFDAMPDGGRLKLAARPLPDAMELTVADTGNGIPPEERDKVFDFGYSTREDGNGLGLAMVYQCIVENHGGSVEILDNEGGGTVFRLILPYHQSGPAEEERS
jgi:signal transduction histidine kinase